MESLQPDDISIIGLGRSFEKAIARSHRVAIDVYSLLQWLIMLISFRYDTIKSANRKDKLSCYLSKTLARFNPYIHRKRQ